MKHPPEPWSGEKIDYRDQCGRYGGKILDANGVVIYSPWLPAERKRKDLCWHDIQLILACVNACAGVDPQSLHPGLLKELVSAVRTKAVVEVKYDSGMRVIGARIKDRVELPPGIEKGVSSGELLGIRPETRKRNNKKTYAKTRAQHRRLVEIAKLYEELTGVPSPVGPVPKQLKSYHDQLAARRLREAAAKRSAAEPAAAPADPPPTPDPTCPSPTPIATEPAARPRSPSTAEAESTSSAPAGAATSSPPDQASASA